MPIDDDTDDQPPDVYQRRRREATVEDDLADLLAGARRAHERHLATAPPAMPPADPVAIRARELADRAALLVESDFPQVTIDRCRMDDPGETSALAAARGFAAQDGRSVLILLGGVGCGKTTAATWLARDHGGRRPGFIRAEKLERRGRYDGDLQRWLDERTLLVVDDLGVEYLDGKGAFTSLLDGLVADYAENRRRLAITSNLAAAELKARLTERIWSRIVTHAAIVSCGDTDLRRLPGATVTAIRGGR